jgi:hypothetical protein
MLVLTILSFIIFVCVESTTISTQTTHIWRNYTTPTNDISISTPMTITSSPISSLEGRSRLHIKTTTLAPTTPFKFILVSSIPKNAPAATVIFRQYYNDSEYDYAVNKFYSLPPGLPTEEVIYSDYEPEYEFMTIELLPTILNMSYVDAVNYVNRKCDELCKKLLCFSIV